MFRDYRMRMQPSIRFADEEGVRMLHRAALKILERTGVVIHHEGAVEMLADAGCRVVDGRRVTIPEHLVEEAIRGTPGSITVLESTGYRRLDEAAIEAARRGTFRAARLNGRPVAGTIEVPFEFHLKKR